MRINKKFLLMLVIAQNFNFLKETIYFMQHFSNISMIYKILYADEKGTRKTYTLGWKQGILCIKESSL